MFKKFRIKLVNLIASDYISELENKVNQRAAEIVSKMDPFEPLMKEFHGVFAEQYEHPEEKLDARGQLGMKMWGWQQNRDPHFRHLTDWIMNTQGNETLKTAPVNTDRILYGRAQISTMILYKKEIGRLSSLYEEELEKQKVPGFDPNKSVE